MEALRPTVTAVASDPMTDDPLQRFRLDGKIALVTGAARGIALVMARAMAAVGAAVALQDIELSLAQQEADRINADGGRAIALGGDACDAAFASRVVADTVSQLGGLHILINSASIQIPQPWLNESVEQIERQLAADLVTPLLLVREVTPIFKKQKFGRIINIGSIQQHRANPGMMTYSLSKGALEKMTAGLAGELAHDQITINCIAPGWINNTVRNGSTDAATLAEWGKRVPIGRLGEPSDFDGVTLLLCGPAGDYITGQSIFVDGGLRF